jgi:hypothetical protein
MPQSTTNAVIVAITERDINEIRSGEAVTDEEERVIIYKRGTDKRQEVPDNYFIIRMSERALDRVDNGENVTYGVRKIGDINQELFVRKGKISERLGTDKTTKQQLIDDGMSREDADRYSS